MQSNTFNFLRQLPSYKLKAILFRIPIISLISIGMLLFTTSFTGTEYFNLPLDAYLKVIIVFIVISEMNVLTGNIMERFYPIPKKIWLRLIIHLVLNFIWAILTLKYFEFTENISLNNNPFIRLMLVFGILFMISLILVSIGIRIIGQWIDNQNELEALKRAKIKSDYSALQDQLNPHFLFNNLSVLKSMIQYEPKAAIEFTQNFTDVYRYVLQSKEKNTVQLNEELDYLNAYIGVHKERLGEGLKVSFDIKPIYMDLYIPPLSLQLLVENAIKHNIASKNDPLFIFIYTKNETITVENKLHLKESSYSTSHGLRNLHKRYELLTKKKITINNTGKDFIVTLPLLEN